MSETLTDLTNPRVLVIDDDPSMRDLLEVKLGKRGVETRLAASAAEGLAALEAGGIEVVVTDLHLGAGNGIDLCYQIIARQPDLPVILMTADDSLDAAVGAIRAGAYDFLVKPLDLDALEIALQRAVASHRLRSEVRRLRRELADTQAFEEILGNGPRITACCELLRRVARSEASVLITGETGTGKELAARAIHRRSARAERPFVAINCAAIPDHLLESELFGHAKGAFTDAKTKRRGLLQRAHGGSLFLDEVGDMPSGLQAKLLRVLEERRFRPLGSDEELEVDLRVVAATRQDLEQRVEAGKFREDLLYRLNVIQVEMPALRERGDDALLLAQHFVQHFAARYEKAVTGLSTPVAERLLEYPWPGNVRELKNCIERAVTLTNHEQLVLDDLPRKVRNGARSEASAAPAAAAGDLRSLAEVEREHIERVLEALGGNKTQAAKVLGLARKTLHRKLERYGADSA